MSRILYVGSPAGGLLTNGEPPRLRDLRGLLGLVVHRFGGWPDGKWIYPETEHRARLQHVPWRSELIGQVYGETPEEIARFAVEVQGWSRHPYTFQVYGGVVYQTAPLDVITPHAGDFNRSHASIMLTGDFRSEAPPAGALDAAAGAAGALCFEFAWPPAEMVTIKGQKAPCVLGHDELPTGATATPGKHCPGDALSMPDFRAMTEERRRRLWLDPSRKPRIVLTS